MPQPHAIGREPFAVVIDDHRQHRGAVGERRDARDVIDAVLQHGDAGRRRAQARKPRRGAARSDAPWCTAAPSRRAWPAPDRSARAAERSTVPSGASSVSRSIGRRTQAMTSWRPAAARQPAATPPMLPSPTTATCGATGAGIATDRERLPMHIDVDQCTTRKPGRMHGRALPSVHLSLLPFWQRCDQSRAISPKSRTRLAAAVGQRHPVAT